MRRILRGSAEFMNVGKFGSLRDLGISIGRRHALQVGRKLRNSGDLVAIIQRWGVQ